MDIAKELKDAKDRREKLAQEINELAQTRQMKLQEFLRVDGEVRMLERLSKDGDKDNKE